MATGFDYSNANSYYFNDNGILQTGWIEYKYFIDDQYGVLYYANNSGALQSGWHLIDGKWYYFHHVYFNETLVTSKDGLDKAEVYRDEELIGFWEIDSKGRWFKFLDGSYPKNKWEQLEDYSNYYFGSDGYAVTGWNKINNKWYYFRDNGRRVTYEHEISNKQHIFDYNNGVWLGQFEENANGRWFVDSNGVNQKNKWVNLNGTYYYSDQNGYLAEEEWKEINSQWYYFNRSNQMEIGRTRIWVKDKLYYLNENGAMQTGWIEAAHSYEGETYTNWYYANSAGVLQTGWKQIGNSWYYFFEYGEMARDYRLIDGVGHIFQDNGVWISEYKY